MDEEKQLTRFNSITERGSPESPLEVRIKATKMQYIRQF